MAKTPKSKPQAMPTFKPIKAPKNGKMATGGVKPNKRNKSV